MASRTQLLTLTAGEHLYSQGDNPDSLFIVLSGSLQMVVESRMRKSVVKELIPGDAVGLIAILAGGKRNSSVIAIKETTLAELDRRDFEELLDKYPDMQQELLEIFFHRLRRTHLAVVLPEYFKVMDEETFDYMESLFEWVHIKRGEALFKKGEVGDSLYILINGLLHVIDDDRERNGLQRLVNVIYTGQTVGEMALLSDEIRTDSTYAVRDCDLVKLSRSAFESISERYPEVMMAIARILVDRLRHASEGTIQEKNNMTIAVFPIASGAITYDFCEQLADAFSAYGPTLFLTARKVDTYLNKRGMCEIEKDDPRDPVLRAWLANMESSHSFDIYMTEKEITPWTKRCLSRADRVILLADAKMSPIPGKVEKEILNTQNPLVEPDKVLVLVHNADAVLPSGTAAWLAERNIEEYYHVRKNNKKDFSRLARLLSHRAVGLALGGGAAKGLAHIGVIRALEEVGIPIDMIGGASMGSIIGACCAMGKNYHAMLHLCKNLFIDINPFTDYTLPIISVVRGRKLDRMGKLAYGDSNIEDLWIPYFCVSTNLTTSRLKIHHRGLLRDAVRTSSSVPGVVAPVFLDGEVYVDGGVINNLPGDIIRQQCGRVIVVEVVPNLDLSVKTTELPSPWKLLWNKLLPHKKRIQVPNILEIMFSTVLTGSFMAANNVKSHADLCITPPLQEIGFLDFKKMQEVAEIGYHHTRQILEKSENTKLLSLLRGNIKEPDNED